MAGLSVSATRRRAAAVARQYVALLATVVAGLVSLNQPYVENTTRF